jgi:hypothetical protein
MNIYVSSDEKSRPAFAAQDTLTGSRIGISSRRTMMVLMIFIWFKVPAGKESNSVQTVPNKDWFMFLRLHGPLGSWFEKTWRPGDIQPII